MMYAYALIAVMAASSFLAFASLRLITGNARKWKRSLADLAKQAEEQDKQIEERQHRRLPRE